MSELTPCNYCSLRWIKERAKKAGNVVTVKPGGIGLNVYVHPPSIHIKESTDPEGYFAASFMELTDYCCC